MRLLLGFLLVMKAELERGFIATRRYWFQTLVGLFISYAALIVLIYGFVYSQGALDSAIAERFDTAERATNFVLGFIIGSFAFGVIGMYTRGLQSMASTGILEQLCISPYGLVTNFLARTFVACVSGVLTSSVLVWLITRTVGGKLHFDPIPVAVLLALTFLNLMGFGFMMGGLVLVFKQIGQLAMVLRLVLFGLAIFARAELYERGGWLLAGLLHLLPITDAAVCLKYVLIHGQTLPNGEFASVFTQTWFFWLVGSCVLWNAIGFVLFRKMENYARHKGTLGNY